MYLSQLHWIFCKHSINAENDKKLGVLQKLDKHSKILRNRNNRVKLLKYLNIIVNCD